MIAPAVLFLKNDWSASVLACHLPIANWHASETLALQSPWISLSWHHTNYEITDYSAAIAGGTDLDRVDCDLDCLLCVEVG